MRIAGGALMVQVLGQVAPSPVPKAVRSGTMSDVHAPESH